MSAYEQVVHNDLYTKSCSRWRRAVKSLEKGDKERLLLLFSC